MEITVLYLNVIQPTYNLCVFALKSLYSTKDPNKVYLATFVYFMFSNFCIDYLKF